jgi:hypothetical protein
MFPISSRRKDNQGLRPVCDLCSTNLILEQFHPGTHCVHDLTPENVEWMKHAEIMFEQTYGFSPLFAEDLQGSCERHKVFMNRILAMSEQ